eukprot:XP_001705851.1 Hypothetical protein GL50803_29248 [Giardia lamblia ATCC 50803]
MNEQETHLPRMALHLLDSRKHLLAHTARLSMQIML